MCALASGFLADALLLVRTLWHALNYRGFFCASCVYFLHLELANPLLADDGHYHTPVYQPGDVNQKMWLSEALKKIDKTKQKFSKICDVVTN